MPVAHDQRITESRKTKERREESQVRKQERKSDDRDLAN